MLESLSSYGASSTTTRETVPKTFTSRITGAVTGITNLLLVSGWRIVVIVGIIGGVLVVFIISRKRIQLRA